MGVNQLNPLIKDRSWLNRYYSRLSSFRNQLNQLGYIIERLKEKPRSKQLFATTFDPTIDIKPNMPYNPKMPCLVAIDFKFRRKLNLFALFRSHDFGRKAYGKYLGLGKLLAYVSEETNLKMGEVICLSLSAHIRLSELKEIQKIVKSI